MQKVIFMGTPGFSVPILQALIEDNSLDIVGVVTQPDRKVGRKQIITPPPVKELALENDLLVLQPEKLSGSEEMQTILDLKPDLLITAAYGQYVPTKLLKAPKFKAINVHASLLPKYRGAAPIHYAVLNGDKKTGVTIMYMEQKMDAGNIITQREISITDEDDTGTLFNKLSIIGRDLLIDTLPTIFEGTNESIVQNEDEVSLSPMISKAQEKIDWNQSAREIFNHVRALRPAPGTYTILKDERFKIWDTQVIEETTTVDAGTIIEADKEQLLVACGEGTVLSLLSVQPSGRKRLNIEEYLSGAELEEGVKFGE